jgi:hypothetical protein
VNLLSNTTCALADRRQMPASHPKADENRIASACLQRGPKRHFKRRALFGH